MTPDPGRLRTAGEVSGERRNRGGLRGLRCTASVSGTRAVPAVPVFPALAGVTAQHEPLRGIATASHGSQRALAPSGTPGGAFSCPRVSGSRVSAVLVSSALRCTVATGGTMRGGLMSELTRELEGAPAPWRRWEPPAGVDPGTVVAVLRWAHRAAAARSSRTLAA